MWHGVTLYDGACTLTRDAHTPKAGGGRLHMVTSTQSCRMEVPEACGRGQCVRAGQPQTGRAPGLRSQPGRVQWALHSKASGRDHPPVGLKALGPAFFPISPFRMGMSTLCLAFHSVLEAHSLLQPSRNL